MPFIVQFSDGQTADASTITRATLFTVEPRLLVEMQDSSIRVFGNGVGADADMLDEARDKGGFGFLVFRVPTQKSNTRAELCSGRELDRIIATDVLKISVPDEELPPLSTNIEAAIGLVESLCRDIGHGRGHFALFMFTTHWKAVFGTPDLDGGDGREQLSELAPAETPAMAIRLAALRLTNETV